MANKISNKRANETFLVGLGTQALYNTAGSGNHINNVSTGAVRLANGQLGVFSAGYNGTVGLNIAIDTTPTFGEVPEIYIAQGTQWSASPSTPSAAYPLWNEPYIKSGNINGRNPVSVKKQTPSVGTHSVWIVGSELTAGAIVALDNTEYQMRIGFRGVRDDVWYSPESTNFVTGGYVTPNYTALATQDPVDHLIQNIAWDINRKSNAIALNKTKFSGNSNVVALAINVNGDSNGTAIGGNGDGASGTTALAAGQVVPVINTNVGVRSITLTSAMATSIKDAAVAAAIEFGTATSISDLEWNILTIDTTTAGLTASGVADLIMLVALDQTPSYVDTIPQVRTRLQVGLTTGFDFNTVNHKQYSYAFEGHGQSRALEIFYQNTHGQRRYNLRHTMDPVIKFPSPIVDGVQYNVYYVNHYDLIEVDTHNMVDAPQVAVVCIPSTDTTLITNFEAIMNAWLASNSQPAIDVV